MRSGMSMVAIVQLFPSHTSEKGAVSVDPVATHDKADEHDTEFRLLPCPDVFGDDSCVQVVPSHESTSVSVDWASGAYSPTAVHDCGVAHEIPLNDPSYTGGSVESDQPAPLNISTAGWS